ncbi:hypothetical protein HK405_003735 [Cladochytrium tenue]|nr:hypothetical protein HK405_003735 [Cladochytrium tenue]
MAPLVKNTLDRFLSAVHPTAPHVFSPIKVGDMTLSHRIVLAPMTRSRSPKEEANDLNALYYAQRATRGALLISEATPISATGKGYPDVPALITDDQARAWQKVTSAVHDKGAHLVAQLWHVGRVSIPDFQPSGAAPVSASATPLISSRAAAGATARALELEEIKAIVKEYGAGARRAIDIAGFDAVELHAAHGYLIDQFLHASSNLRTDEYGGSIENRARFLFEALDAVVAAVPASRVGIRLSPFLGTHEVKDDATPELFSYVVRKLQDYRLAYIHFSEPATFKKPKDAPVDWHATSQLNQFIELVKAPTKVLITGGYYLAEAEVAISSGRAHLIAMGRPFITNPDLVLRLWNGSELFVGNDPTGMYYLPGPKGYTDFDTLLEAKAKKFVEASTKDADAAEGKANGSK